LNRLTVMLDSRTRIFERLSRRKLNRSKLFMAEMLAQYAFRYDILAWSIRRRAFRVVNL
jgi:hypothetical protein